MDWTELKIYTSSEGLEPLTGRLMNAGITGFVIRDSRDFDDFLARRDGNWDYYDDDLEALRECETCVTVYLPDNAEGAETLSMVRSELASLRAADVNGAFGRLEYDLGGIREEDWANNWKQYFKPLRIGSKLLIKPSWEKADCGGARTVVEIDPAASFGTGQHNTTQLCLELLEQSIRQGDRLLDLGAGSGILSVAAVKLGAKSAVAVDIEENAAKASAENARKNGIPKDCYKALCGNICEDTALREEIGADYDIVCANIVADVLIAMSGLFGGFLKDGGRLVVSGILEKRLGEVTDAIVHNGFILTEQRQKDDWCACAFVKN